MDVAPGGAKFFFYLSQILILALFVGAAIYLRWLRGPGSSFSKREADRKGGQREAPESARFRIEDPLAQARFSSKSEKSPHPETLALPGIRIQGSPYEILGLSENCTEEQLQQTYRDLMKRYHPDRVGRPGTREWNDAQKIAEAINRARSEILKRIQPKSPNRSGR